MTQVCPNASLKGEPLSPESPGGATEGEEATFTMDFAGLHQSPDTRGLAWEGWTNYSTDVSTVGIAIRNHRPNHHKWVVETIKNGWCGFAIPTLMVLSQFLSIIWSDMSELDIFQYVIVIEHIYTLLSIHRCYGVIGFIAKFTAKLCPHALCCWTIHYSPRYWYSVYPREFTVECIVFLL